jgi:hypothetical protein
MSQRGADIAAWATGGATGKKAFDGTFTGGTVLERGATSTVVGTAARVVLKGTGSGGFFVLTGFPLP